jgi:soluble lytic murein transglycosylase-like protein
MTEPREKRPEWKIVLLSILAVTVAFLLSGTIVALRSLERAAPRGQGKLEAAERRMAAASRRLADLNRREQLRQGIELEILRANPRLAAAEALEYSRLLLEVTEKYSTIDPVFLLAIGIVESRFTAQATSHAAAKGLYQIWPATGRWLASELGWEYSEAMLYVPEKNIELAACYLDKLFETYRDPRLVLAEYNGGPINARRLKSGSHRLAAETRDYVVKVMTVHDGLNQRLDSVMAEVAEPQRPVRVASLGSSSAFAQ